MPMNRNEQLITNFYKALNNKDYKTMQASYADDTMFADAVFENLNADEVKAMWQMLCVKSTDLHIDCNNIIANDKKGNADWVATYTFLATGKKVINRVSASFTFVDGKIISHTDNFDFYSWSKQAFGLAGWLLGWTGFFKNKVRKTAIDNLNRYINNNQIG